MFSCTPELTPHQPCPATCCTKRRFFHLLCRAEKVEQTPGNTAAATAPNAKRLRVAVKQIGKTHLPHTAALVQQEADLLSKFAGKPFMVDFHGLFWSSADTPTVENPAKAQQNCAYIVMGYAFCLSSIA